MYNSHILHIIFFPYVYIYIYKYRDPAETPRTLRQYYTEGHKGPYYAHRREPVGQPKNKIPVWPGVRNVFILLENKLHVKNK